MRVRVCCARIDLSAHMCLVLLSLVLNHGFDFFFRGGRLLGPLACMRVLAYAVAGDACMRACL
jgi:hypothetical protein